MKSAVQLEASYPAVSAIDALTVYSPTFTGTLSVYVVSSAPLTLYSIVTSPSPVLPVTEGVLAVSPYFQSVIETAGSAVFFTTVSVPSINSIS